MRTSRPNLPPAEAHERDQPVRKNIPPFAGTPVPSR
jgi:hypothetical protein